MIRSRSYSRSRRSWMISRCSSPRKPQRKPKPSATEDFWLEGEARVVQPQLLQSIAQHRMLVRVDRVETGEDHALDVFESRQRFGSGIVDRRDRVADLRVGDVLDGRDEEADFAGGELLELNGLRRHYAHRLDVERLAVRHDLDLVALTKPSVDDAREHNHAAVRIEPRVEDERLQRSVGVALRRRQQVHDGFEDVGNVLAGLRRDRNGIVRRQPDRLLDHLLRALDVGAGQVDLVDDRNDVEPVRDGEVRVGQRLGLDALRGVDDQQRALARGERARDLVAEVDMAGRVDQVELIGVAVAGVVHHAHGVRLDGDAALALEIHRVEDLRLHLPRGQRAGELQQPVGERGFAVVDVRDDREIADKSGVHAVGPRQKPRTSRVASAVARF